jgi:hypothetical protein
MNEQEWMDQAEARNRVGRAIFGKDWIAEPFSKADLELLQGDYGPKDKVLENKRTVTMIGPRPARIAEKIDRAFGRAQRYHLQVAFAVDWMENHRVSCAAPVVAAAAIDKAIAAWEKSQQDAEDGPELPGPGRRAKKLPLALSTIRNDINNNKLTPFQLQEMPLKALADRLGIGKTLASVAKKIALSPVNSRK